MWVDRVAPESSTSADHTDEPQQAWFVGARNGNPPAGGAIIVVVAGGVTGLRSCVPPMRPDPSPPSSTTGADTGAVAATADAAPAWEPSPCCSVRLSARAASTSAPERESSNRFRFLDDRYPPGVDRHRRSTPVTDTGTSTGSAPHRHRFRPHAQMEPALKAPRAASRRGGTCLWCTHGRVDALGPGAQASCHRASSLGPSSASMSSPPSANRDLASPLATATPRALAGPSTARTRFRQALALRRRWSRQVSAAGTACVPPSPSSVSMWSRRTVAP